MSAKNKAALQDWDKFRKSIEQSTVVDYNEHPAVQERRIKQLEANDDEWCKYYFPHYCESDFAPFHRRFFRNIQKGEKVFIVNKWSRAHAKSVSVMMISLKMALTGQVKNILLASYNEANAIELLRPFKINLESNQRLINDYGIQKSLDQWEAGKFVTRTGVSFRAIGSGQSPRGTRDEEQRPQLIICDDLDEDEMCRNPKRLDDAFGWMMGSLYGTFDTVGVRKFVVVGNRIAKDCLLERAVEKADYYEQVNLLNEDGKPSWPERNSIEDCNYMIQKMGSLLAQREYFNNPLSVGKVFKAEWMQYKKLPPLSSYRFLCAYLDPGFKSTKTSDSKSWNLVGLYDGQFHIRKVFCSKATIEEMIGWGYELNTLCKRKGAAVSLRMEEVFLQDLLYKDFAEAARKRMIPLPVSGDKRKKPDKDSRIAAIAGHFERGSVYFDEDIRNDHHCKTLVDQFLVFEIGVKTPKDGPDAIEGAFFILQQMVHSQGAITAGRNKVSARRF